MHRQFVTAAEEPELHFLVHHFARQLRAEAPEVMLLPDDEPVLYSTGMPGYLVISEGSLAQLSSEELERRLVHELRKLSTVTIQ